MNDLEVVLPGEGVEGVDVDGAAVEVGGGDALGFWGDFLGGVGGVHLEGVFAAVDEDGDHAFGDEHVGGGDVGPGGDEDLVAALEEGAVGELEGGGAVGAGQAVLGAAGLGEAFFELGHFLAARSIPDSRTAMAALMSSRWSWGFMKGTGVGLAGSAPSMARVVAAEVVTGSLLGPPGSGGGWCGRHQDVKDRRMVRSGWLSAGARRGAAPGEGEGGLWSPGQEPAGGCVSSGGLRGVARLPARFPGADGRGKARGGLPGRKRVPRGRCACVDLTLPAWIDRPGIYTRV